MKFLLNSLILLLLHGNAWSYPLDAAGQTGIKRLEGYQLFQEGKVKGRKLFPGALFDSNQIQLRMLEATEVTLPEVDVELTEEIGAYLGEDLENYNFSILDLSDQQHPVYAEHLGEVNFNPASLGKILIAVATLQALADRYPDDIEARKKLLRDRQIVADQFILNDHHKVPIWHEKRQRMIYRSIQLGDTGNLWSWLDWMLSPSSNAAAAMVLREYLLMVQFGDQYPVTAQKADEFLKQTSKQTLMQLLIRSMREPLRRNGIDPNQLRQGGFFTRNGKQLIPGGSSRANTRSLLQLLLKIEQGTLIDRFSSLELKKLLYLTEKRIRYASHPALKHSAVYFKSGSLYSCTPEEGFECGKYQGNRKNLLNSIAIIEQQGEELLHYLVIVSSNVLKVNSAVAHQTLAMRIHRLLENRQQERLKKRGIAE